MNLKLVAGVAFLAGVVTVIARKTSAKAAPDEIPPLAKPGEKRVSIAGRQYFVTKSDGQHLVERRNAKTDEPMGSALVSQGSIVELYGEEGQDESLAQLAQDLRSFPKETWN